MKDMQGGGGFEAYIWNGGYKSRENFSILKNWGQGFLYKRFRILIIYTIEYSMNGEQ